MNEFINDILSWLRAVPGVEYAAVYNQQYERINQGDEAGEAGYLFAMPAVFVDFDFSEVKQMGQGYQLYEPVRVTLHIVCQQLDSGDGYLDQNSIIIPLKNSIFLAVQKKYPTRGGMMVRTSETADYGHNNLYVWKQIYTTTLVDHIGRDPINGVTLQPPISFNISNTLQ